MQLLFLKNGELFFLCYLVVLRSVSIVNMLNVLRDAYGSVLILIYALSDFVRELLQISYVSWKSVLCIKTNLDIFEISVGLIIIPTTSHPSLSGCRLHLSLTIGNNMVNTHFLDNWTSDKWNRKQLSYSHLKRSKQE